MYPVLASMGTRTGRPQPAFSSAAYFRTHQIRSAANSGPGGPQVPREKDLVVYVYIYIYIYVYMYMCCVVFGLFPHTSN